MSETSRPRQQTADTTADGRADRRADGTVDTEPDTNAVEIVIADTVDDALVAAFARLIPQLSSSSPAPGAAQLTELVDHGDTALFVARLDGAVVGTLTLAFYRIPTGVKAWIEDVVVDEQARGHGIGRLLNEAALAEAQRRGAKDVSLTSRPSREAANRLYQRIGFERRDTNVYRYKF